MVLADRGSGQHVSAALDLRRQALASMGYVNDLDGRRARRDWSSDLRPSTSSAPARR
jgi:hypothetical protein